MACWVYKADDGPGKRPPEIAQLVERLTVEVTQKSDGPWFESGFPDAFYSDRLAENALIFFCPSHHNKPSVVCSS